MQPFESVTVTVIGKLPVSVGVPESVSIEKLIPFGSAPVSENVTEPMPPVCVNVVAGYGVPVVACGRVAGASVIVWQLTTSVYVALVPVQPFASVTVTTIGNEPVWPGVPASVPFGARDIPDGSVDAVVNVAPPIAPACVNVWLNAVPIVAFVVAGFVTTIVWQPIERLYVALVPVQRFASVIVTTIGKRPVCVGVPARTPFAARLSPAGSVDAVVNVAVPIAPACVNVWLNAVPAVPAGHGGVRHRDRLAGDDEVVRRAASLAAVRVGRRRRRCRSRPPASACRRGRRSPRASCR